MGLGAYLASVTERAHYVSEEKRERDEVVEKPEDEKAEICEILEKYGVGRDACALVVRDLATDSDKWVQVSITDWSESERTRLTRYIVHDGLRAQA